MKKSMIFMKRCQSKVISLLMSILRVMFYVLHTESNIVH